MARRLAIAGFIVAVMIVPGAVVVEDLPGLDPDAAPEAVAAPIEGNSVPSRPARLADERWFATAGASARSVRRAGIAAPALPYRVAPFRIQSIPVDELPYVEAVFPTQKLPPLHDASGIPMKRVGSGLFYSPAGLLQYAIRMEDAYRRGGDDGYLAIADRILAKMMAIGTRSNGGVYIPYEYDFPMHRIASEVMRGPWYSAMAQGLALTLAVRLHRDTGKAMYLTDADLLFASFRHLGRSSAPWVAYADPDRYLWLEEYAESSSPSDHTANGFNFAVFGLYDYYEETRSSSALQILQASLTTMRRYIADYRNPGTYSDYCLRHGKPQPKYHRIVTWQLEVLSRMTGDEYFLEMSRQFAADSS